MKFHVSATVTSKKPVSTSRAVVLDHVSDSTNGEFIVDAATCEQAAVLLFLSVEDIDIDQVIIVDRAVPGFVERYFEIDGDGKIVDSGEL